MSGCENCCDELAALQHEHENLRKQAADLQTLALKMALDLGVCIGRFKTFGQVVPELLTEDLLRNGKYGGER